MPLLRLKKEENHEQRSARRLWEKRWSKLLRKSEAQVNAKYKPEYVLDKLQNVFGVSMDYVKSENEKVYDYIKHLVEKKEAPKPAPKKAKEAEPKAIVAEEKNDALDELEAEELS